MARLIYACRFEINSAKAPKAVSSAYSSWITRHYVERRNLTKFNFDLTADTTEIKLPDGHSLNRAQFNTDKGQVTRLQWIFPAEADAGLEWQNEIRIGEFDGTCSVEHLIYINSVNYLIAPARVTLGSPSVIRQLCSETTVQIGEMHVRATPYRLSIDKVSEFVSLLKSPERRLPLVFLAPYSNGDANLIDAGRLAQHLAGVGIVVEVRDAEVTWELGGEIGRTLNCYNGGARIYWPGFSNDQDARSHRLFIGSRIEETGDPAIAQAIQRSIFAVAAFRFVPDQRITDIIREAEKAERQQRIEDKKGKYQVDVPRLTMITSHNQVRRKWLTTNSTFATRSSTTRTRLANT